jgi:hypothetical protein
VIRNGYMVGPTSVSAVLRRPRHRHMMAETRWWWPASRTPRRLWRSESPRRTDCSGWDDDALEMPSPEAILRSVVHGERRLQSQNGTASGKNDCPNCKNRSQECYGSGVRPAGQRAVDAGGRVGMWKQDVSYASKQPSVSTTIIGREQLPDRILGQEHAARGRLWNVFWPGAEVRSRAKPIYAFRSHTEVLRSSGPRMRLGDGGVPKAEDVGLNRYVGPNTIRKTATFDHPNQLPAGMQYALRNAVPVMNGGKMTDALLARPCVGMAQRGSSCTVAVRAASQPCTPGKNKKAALNEPPEWCK